MKLMRHLSTGEIGMDNIVWILMLERAKLRNNRIESIGQYCRLDIRVANYNFCAFFDYFCCVSFMHTSIFQELAAISGVITVFRRYFIDSFRFTEALIRVYLVILSVICDLMVDQPSCSFTT